MLGDSVMSTFGVSGIADACAWDPLADVRVMLIDDSTTICQGARAVLGGAGCHVVTAPDGFAALVEVIDCPPDIIFVDNHMPRLDGYQACALIKRNEQFRHLPVILLTNLDHQVDQARAHAAGIDGHLTKPFSGDELLNAVRQHLQGGAGAWNGGS